MYVSMLTRGRVKDRKEKRWKEDGIKGCVEERKVAAVRLISFYRRHCTHRNMPVFKLLRDRFWGLSPHSSPRRGDMLHRLGEVPRLVLPFGPLLCAKFYPHQCNDKGIGPQNWNYYWDLIKMWNINAPHGRIPSAMFTKFVQFVPHFRML